VKWSIEKLVSGIENILQRLSIEKDENEKRMLKIDYMVFLDMIRIMDESLYQKYKSIYFVEETYFSLHNPFTNDFYKDSFENILKEQSRFIDICRITDRLYVRNVKPFYKRKIDEEDYMKMVDSFFRNFDPKMYELYLRLLKDNINMTKEKYKFASARGICYFDRLNNEPFVTAKFNDMRDASILPHEVGHAYQMMNLSDDNLVLKYHLSGYRETYSKMLELIFIHENINSKYRRALLDEERSIYDEIAVVSDGYLEAIYNMDGYDMKKGIIKSPKGIMPKSAIDDILSRTLAIYFYSIYLEDKDKFNEVITLFNNNIARVSDSELTNMFPKRDILNATNVALRIFPKH